MRVAFSELKNTKVYMYGEKEPFGILADTVLDEFGHLWGYVIKTLSIVPISKIVKKENIEDIGKDKIVLTVDADLKSPEMFKKEACGKILYATALRLAKTPGNDIKKLKDMSFDFEAGQICDIKILKNIITGKKDISVNKIYAKDNTIYVEKYKEEG